MKRFYMGCAIAAVTLGLGQQQCELTKTLVADTSGGSDPGSWPGRRVGGGTRAVPIDRALNLARTMPHLNSIVARLHQSGPSHHHWSQYGQLGKRYPQQLLEKRTVGV